LGILLFISVSLLLCYTVLILFYRSGWVHLNEFVPNKHYFPKTKVSIIIPARNEANTIPKLLQDILSQYYPTHLIEIIVVDDYSTDDTAQIVETYKGIRLIKLNEFTNGQILNSYKKKAIEIAIAQSNGELIITTDADCSMDAYWLHSLVQYYETYKPKLIAAPVAFNPIRNWFDRFQSIDFMTMQGITGAVSQTKSGTMCNGANLAYTKEAFTKVNGFKGIDDIASGDDMLLMYKIEQTFPNETVFLKCKDAIVNTSTMPSIQSFINQRIRWASKATKFKDWRIKAILLLVYLLNLMLFILFILSFLEPKVMSIFIGFLITKIIIEYYFIKHVATFFKKENELFSFAPLQFIHILYILISGLLGQFGTYTWKNRTVK
jgi:cellulose synthase/poly-beta-1,6-N-acetylglucosamine synthase-like glycosyltransferase